MNRIYIGQLETDVGVSGCFQVAFRLLLGTLGYLLVASGCAWLLLHYTARNMLWEIVFGLGCGCCSSTHALCCDICCGICYVSFQMASHGLNMRIAQARAMSSNALV
jgi:hypothetical protein